MFNVTIKGFEIGNSVNIPPELINNYIYLLDSNALNIAKRFEGVKSSVKHQSFVPLNFEIKINAVRILLLAELLVKHDKITQNSNATPFIVGDASKHISKIGIKRPQIRKFAKSMQLYE